MLVFAHDAGVDPIRQSDLNISLKTAKLVWIVLVNILTNL